MAFASREQRPGEEVANTVIHVVGSHLAAAMTVLLIWQAVDSGVMLGWKIVAASIFGASMVLLYSISSAYHAVMYPPAKRVLHVMDHMAIYFLIAGSYTPFCFVTLRPEHPALAWTIFGIEWGATFIGVWVKVFTTGRFRVISTLAYIVMGWMALVAIVPLVKALHGLGTMWLALGGVLYTLGCIFYLWKRLPYGHAVWHLFVLAATLCHFFCILWYVM